MYAIETKNLTKYYGKSRGIIDVSLKVEEGDYFGFIGPNGAGKSTTIRILSGLISKTSGEGFIFGNNVSEKKLEALSNIGYLPSETNLYSDMKAWDTIMFSSSLRKMNCEKEAKTLCERLNLDVSKRINELSLGNRKKVAIVCALQHSPKLYILDEPTSGLDPLIQKEFYSILKERNENGATIFLSSHALWEIEKHCKTAAVIKEGKIIVSDSVEKLSYTGIKKVSLKGINEKIKIENATNVSYENGNMNFLYNGNAKKLISDISGFEFDDINISDPELDEVFMHYYKENGESNK